MALCSSYLSVYNLKRRMVSLPPVSFEIFSGQVIDTDNRSIQPTPITVSTEVMNEADSETDLNADEASRSILCIFCSTTSSSLGANVEHMSASHQLVIPHLHHLTDLDSFIIYLNTLVQTFHECIYCSHTRHSVESIRHHMIHKQHCRLDLSEESDLLDFWEFPEATDDDDKHSNEEELRYAKLQRLSNAEIILPSGTVVLSRTSRVGGKQVKKNRKPLPALPSSSERNDTTAEIPRGQSSESSTPSTEITRTTQALDQRNEMGLTGISSQQRLQLRAVEKRMLKQEALAQAHQRWGVERAANRQKHFKVRHDVLKRASGDLSETDTLPPA
jgi:pre-60S factor REI1